LSESTNFFYKTNNDYVTKHEQSLL
jgi:hypothetical protein